MSSASPQDNMRPISHALPFIGNWWFEHQSAAEIGLFCVPVPIADDETMHDVAVAIEKSDCLPAAGYGIRPVCEGLGIVSVTRLRQHAND